MSAAPAVIKATFSDYKRVRGRKVGQLIFEVPLERLHDAIADLGGEPSIESDTWVAIARLQEAAEKWKPEEQHPAKECALVCQRATFWNFLSQERNARCENEEDAATFVRRFCKINTRADLATNPAALNRWRLLQSAYHTWLPQ